MEYHPFRLLARDSFSDLVVSVMMYDKGSGIGGELTMYRVKVSGQPIGPAPLSAEAPSAEQAIQNLIALVGPARRKVKQQRDSLLSERSGGAVGKPGELRRAA